MILIPVQKVYKSKLQTPFSIILRLRLQIVALFHCYVHMREKYLAKCEEFSLNQKIVSVENIKLYILNTVL